jgi:hypothetical protein
MMPIEGFGRGRGVLESVRKGGEGDGGGTRFGLLEGEDEIGERLRVKGESCTLDTICVSVPAYGHFRYAWALSHPAPPGLYGIRKLVQLCPGVMPAVHPDTSCDSRLVHLVRVSQR